MEHNSDFKYDLKWGQKGESLVADIQSGETTEVKSERNIWAKTGNVFIEFWSRGKPSGILTTESVYWSTNFMLNDKLVCNVTVYTKDLKKLVVNKKDEYRVVDGGDNNTSRGFLIPRIDLLNIHEI